MTRIKTQKNGWTNQTGLNEKHTENNSNKLCGSRHNMPPPLSTIYGHRRSDPRLTAT